LLRYFPFEQSFDPGMGMRMLKPHEPLCEVDPNTYAYETALKQRLLTEDHNFYFKGGAATMNAQWDVLELVMKNLAQVYPEQFRLRHEGDAWCWQNILLARESSFRFGDPGTLPDEPLDWIGRHVQEDLVVLSDDATVTFIGGQLCFANGWDIADRVGKSFLEIHRRTPLATMPSVETGSRFLQSLKPGHTYWRMSWNFKLSNQLDMTTKREQVYKADFAIRAPRLTSADVGQAVFIRIERQTFTRLPRSNALLFGIHTYNSSVAEEAAKPHRARAILNVLLGAPREVKDYKAITPIERPLVEFLQSRESR
jgi:hypothetical protein